jgi:hypothetical protein
MPHQTQLRADDPGRVGRYLVAGRIAGIPSDDAIYVGTGPDGTEVAISMLGGDWARDPAARDRFAAEAAVAKRVPPFCAARVLDAGIEASSAYLISEYVPGQTLLEIVATDGVLSGAQLESVAIGMATGLASVHQAGLVHGHFGPEYVILPPDGPLRVVEFAITPPYGPATPSADMFAWAQTVFYAAAGRPAAAMSDLHLLPAHFRGVVQACLDRDPVERPAARAVVQALLGDATPAAGVLAEGSRRATRSLAGSLRYDGHSATRLGGHSPTRSAQDPARRPSGVPGGVGPVAARTQDPRPLPGKADVAGRRLPAGQSARMTQRPSAGRRPGGQPPDVQRRPAGQPSRSHQQTGSRGRRAGIIVGVVLVLAVLAGAAVLHLMQNSGSPGSDKGVGATGTRSSPAASTSSPSLTPAAFAGSWKGHATQPPGDSYLVTVNLTADATGGYVSYTGAVKCSAALTVSSATHSKLAMTQTGGCPRGTVTVTLTGGRTVRFTFLGLGGIGKGQVPVTGTLTRS